MTNITKLAQRMKAAAEPISSGYLRNWIVFHDDETCWVGANDDDGNLTPFIEVSIADWSGNKADNEKLARFIALCRPANIIALVEALEKAQTINAAAEKLVRCKGRYHSEQNYRALAALFGVTTPDLPPLDSESRTVTVKLPKPHAHLIWIQAGHAPDDYWDDVAVSHSEKDRCCDGSERYPVYARWEIEEMLTAAGIKMEAE